MASIAEEQPTQREEKLRPSYSYPGGLVTSVAMSLLLNRRRSISADAMRLVAGLVPAPCVFNAHLIPRDEPFAVLTNHYYKPGYNAWWGTALITATVAQAQPPGREVIWLMTNRWTYPDWRGRVITPLTYTCFTRLARVYGFITMPPMPPQPRHVDEAVRAVRRLLALLSMPNKPLLGIAPEGRDSQDGGLIEPPPGVGRMLLHIADHGLRMLPVGVAEVDGALTVRFGPPFALRVTAAASRGVGRTGIDRLASSAAMVAIGAQLPPDLWGVYRSQIKRALASREEGIQV